jgi:hypothetical protein
MEPATFLIRARTLLWAVSLAAVALQGWLLLESKRALAQPPRRPRELRVARLKYAGDWNSDPRAIANLSEDLGKGPARLGLPVTQTDLFPADPNLVYFSLLYLHGRGVFSFSREDLSALRRHLQPGGGTLFADAGCGSPAFDAAFRRFVAELFPKESLVRIPHDDVFYSRMMLFDLKDCQYTKAAGGRRHYPRLEGVKVDGRWAVIYSRYGIGCALDGKHRGECKGYLPADAARITGNAVVYSVLP